MRILIIISFIFLVSCTKGERFKIVASGEKYNITIETNESIMTYINVEGKFKEIVRAESVTVYGNIISGDITYEVFKNGNLCGGAYNNAYTPGGQLDIEIIICN